MTFNSNEIPDELHLRIPIGKELRCPHWVNVEEKLPEIGNLDKFLMQLDILGKHNLIKGNFDLHTFKTEFKNVENITRKEVLDYLTEKDIRLGKTCNKKFCNGDASPDPQEFKCPNCGNKTIFQRLI